MQRLYTDGACSSNGKRDAKASYAYVFPDNLSESYAEPLGAEETQTNNMAELLAIYHGLQKAKRRGATSVTLYSDSEYAINCITKWSPGWIRNGWKTSAGKPVTHREILEKILETLKSFEAYTITHVPAHTGGTDEHSKWNDVADRMAVKALEVGGPVSYGDLAEAPPPPPPTDVPLLRDCPLKIMGPPVSELELVTYIQNHIPDLLAEDEAIVRTGLITIMKRLLSKRNLDLDKQTVHKRTVYRLTNKTLIVHNDDQE
jgi:ribonuclease HI